MTQCWVTVAVYASLGAALAGWDTIDGHDAPVGRIGILDAALVEGDADTIRVFHRHTRRTYGQGALAGAVIGLLQPPAIVTGAVAGGIGGNVLIEIGHGLSRSQVKLLGDVLDAAPIALVALCVGRDEPSWGTALCTATQMATVTSETTAERLRRAFDADAAE